MRLIRSHLCPKLDNAAAKEDLDPYIWKRLFLDIIASFIIFCEEFTARRWKEGSAAQLFHCCWTEMSCWRRMHILHVLFKSLWLMRLHSSVIFRIPWKTYQRDSTVFKRPENMCAPRRGTSISRECSSESLRYAEAWVNFGHYFYESDMIFFFASHSVTVGLCDLRWEMAPRVPQTPGHACSCCLCCLLLMSTDCFSQLFTCTLVT